MKITKDLYRYVHPTDIVSGKEASVRYEDEKRIKKARKQLISTSNPVGIQRIIELTVDFLVKIDVYEKEDMDINNYKKDKLRFTTSKRTCKYDRKIVDLNYQDIVGEKGLNSSKHIIWMKFAHLKTEVEKKYLVVVARSDDVNFSIPTNAKDYGNKNYNTSGIIVHKLEMEWDEDFVLLFPIPKVGDHEMKDIECGVGEYLLENNVPIIDFYSHKFQ